MMSFLILPILLFMSCEGAAMKKTIRVQLIMAVIIALSMLNVSFGSPAPVPPPAPSPTIWNFLGIPKTMNKIRDTTTNRRGNRPNAERKDAIKRIADPANLESDNLAIKTAAKIKADQDAAPQKIKAIKYLATVGCACYPGVKEALLASLDDCTEEVRYEAAVAFCKAAGCSCNCCDKSGCCSPEVMQKLQDMACGQDENGCCKESSARVRAAAAMALNACRGKVGATAPQTSPVPNIKHEGPTPAQPNALPEPEPTTLNEPQPLKAAEPVVTLRIVSPTPAENTNTTEVVQTSATMRVQVESNEGNVSP
jgi:hypothetical protein